MYIEEEYTELKIELTKDTEYNQSLVFINYTMVNLTPFFSFLMLIS